MSTSTTVPAPGQYTSPALSERATTVRSSAVRDLLRLTEQPHMLSLAGGLPAPEMLPAEAVAAATARLLRECPGRSLQYGPTEGMVELRTAVASRLAVTTGADAAALLDGTVVTTGSQQALDLLARVLLDPGDVVVTESPTYLGALSALHWVAPTIEPVEADSDGLDTESLQRRLEEGLAPRVVYVVSNFANPTGATLSLPRRRHLAALADRFDFWIVEDDPYGALRFRGEQLPPMRTWTDRAVTLGSASKVISPGLRVGWLTATAALARAVTIAKQGVDLHTASLNQLIVAELLADPDWFAGHVTAIVDHYSVRCDALVAALDRHLGDRIRVNRPDGGMFVWGRSDVPAEALLAAAVEEGVAFVPGSAFAPDGRDDATLRMCFTTLSPADVDLAAQRLARAMARLTN